MWNYIEGFHLLLGMQVPRFWLVCVCVCLFWPRLPEADDCGGDNYSAHVSFPVAARLCPYSPGFSPTFLRCSCSIPDGLAFQWPGWPVKVGAASRGERCGAVLMPLVQSRMGWRQKGFGMCPGWYHQFLFIYLGNINSFPGKKWKQWTLGSVYIIPETLVIFITWHNTL